EGGSKGGDRAVEHRRRGGDQYLLRPHESVDLGARTRLRHRRRHGQLTDPGGGVMSGLQLMIPPFVACMVLVAMLSYLGLHVIAREVVFVDLSVAQMAALGSLTAMLIHVEADSTWAYAFTLAATALGALLCALTCTSHL